MLTLTLSVSASTTEDTVTFSSDGYKIESKDTRDQPDGKVGTSTTRVQGRYLGPCSK